MWLKLHPPFGEGKEWEKIDLPSPTNMEKFLDRLRLIHPEMEPYFRKTVEETIHHFILIRGDYVLNVKDPIYPGDSIVVMMPLTGG